MTGAEKVIVLAIQTANDWSSDQKGNGLALLSLGTTRKIHSEDHRKQSLDEIDGCIDYASKHNQYDDVEGLAALRIIVGLAGIGLEWMSYCDYARFNEELYHQGVL